MELDLRGRCIRNPEPHAIPELLAKCADGSGFYASLSASRRDFVQAAGCTADGFWLEYKDGQKDSALRRTVDHKLTLDTVIRVFQQYLRGDCSWRSELRWEPVDLRRQRVTSWIVVFLFSLLMLAYIIWQSQRGSPAPSPATP